MVTTQTANANPTEEVIIFSSEECKDDWYGDDATCGKYKDVNGTEQWDSQVQLSERIKLKKDYVRSFFLIRDFAVDVNESRAISSELITPSVSAISLRWTVPL